MIRFLILTLIALTFSTTTFAQDNITTRTIHVQGEGIVKVIPDHAVISLNLNVRDKDAKAAAQKSEKAMAEIVEDLKKIFSVSERDLQTDMIRINPIYINCHNKNELARLKINPANCEEAMINYYNTSRSLTIKYRDLDQIPDFITHILNVALDNETALSLSNISLEHSHVKSLKEEARLKAAEDAKEKATTLANALDAKLGDILQIQVDNIFTPTQPMPQFARGGAPKLMAMAESASYDNGNSFEAGEMEIHATINTIFALD